MLADADLARLGALLGDGRRAAMLLALMSGEELSAGELAARAGASSSLAAAHLAKLRDGGLILDRRQGRERRYRLAGPAVAEALEHLLALAPPRPPRSLRESNRGAAIQRARTCYDHLAGELGVGLTEALERQGALETADAGYSLTRSGTRRLTELGVDITNARQGKRAFARQCLDWTERRPHLAGALGAALADRFFELEWVSRRPGSRALTVTPQGASELRARFGLVV
jgi:DNA-binding transcriptional ArsR family regulator